MRNSIKARAIARIGLHYRETQNTVAHEMTRSKPEAAMAFTRTPFWSGLLTRVRSWFSRLLGLGFLDMGRPATSSRHPTRGYGVKKNRVKRWKATEPRAFGKAGRKLARKIKPETVKK